MSESVGEYRGGSSKVTKAIKVGAALGVAAGLTGALAKGIHDQQPELEARVDYNAANRLEEQRQREVHHTKYFKQRREGDGYGYGGGKRVELYNRISPREGQDFIILKEPSPLAERLEGSIKTEADGSILGVPVYGDKWFMSDSKDRNGATFIKSDDKAEDMVGYYQGVRVFVGGKEITGYLMENHDLNVVKSISDPNKNQGVMLVDLSKK